MPARNRHDQSRVSSKPRSERSFAKSEHQPRDIAASANRFIARNVRIVHEDEHLIVIDKPIGLVSADPSAQSVDADSHSPPKTLFEMVKRHVRSAQPRRKGPPIRVFVIHRLDKEASGLIVFAKTREAFNWLKEDFKAKRVHRVYYAVAEGVVGPAGSVGTRQSFIPASHPTPKPSHRGRFKHSSSSKHPSPIFDATANDDIDDAAAADVEGDHLQNAVTHYHVLAAGHNRTLLQLRLSTGRKNQIRIHFSQIGHPLIGDRRFGAKSNPIDRLALHAGELAFTHPATGQEIRFTSPPPSGFYRSVGLKPTKDLPVFPSQVGSEQASPNMSMVSDSKSQDSVAQSATDPDTSWNQVSRWYDQLLEGTSESERNDHYTRTILPGALRLLSPTASMNLLDVACGQGILCRTLRTQFPQMRITACDSAAGLIDAARRHAKSNSDATTYLVADARNLDALNLPAHSFDAAASIMALSNIEPLEPMLTSLHRLLRPMGAFVFVITHPAFRAISRTSWGWDDQRNLQYRRVESYLSSDQRPILMHPGKAARKQRGGETQTWTFHRPLQAYSKLLHEAGFAIERLEEWPSMRESTSGPRASEENRARREIPLFLGVRAIALPR